MESMSNGQVAGRPASLAEEHLPGPPRWQHQLATYRATRDQPYWALNFEQRCGKTPVLLDTARHLFLANKITALLYVGPKGVHRDLVTDYLPVFLGCPYTEHVWNSDREGTVEAARSREWMLEAGYQLRVVSINIDAIITKRGRDFLAKFIHAHRGRVLAAVDESLDISDSSAERTKVAVKIARRCAYRRILDGTPLDAGPLGIFSQCEFLREGLLGFTSEVAFRQRYAEMKDLILVGKPRWNREGTYDERVFDKQGKLIPNRRKVKTIRKDEDGRPQYQNLAELAERLAPFTTRVTRDQCADMPPKVYERRSFELGPNARSIYDQMKQRFTVELLRGREMTAPIVLTRYLRLQQVASHHAVLDPEFSLCDTCEGMGCPRCEDYGVIGGESETVALPDENTRLMAFADVVKRLPPDEQVIVWTRFRFDVAAIKAYLQEQGERFVVYDGSADVRQRAHARHAFAAGAARFFVGNARAGGRGLDLSAAGTVIYYSHDWGLRWRRQSEDRAQSLMKKSPVLYVTLVASNTVDERIVAAHAANREVADYVLARAGRGEGVF